jgi:multiple sugar transport system permease protein
MKEKYLKWILIIPALIIIVSLVIYPLIYALRASLFLYRYGKPVEFVGLNNYLELFRNKLFYNSLRNTGIYVALAVSVEFILGLILALIMNRELGKFRGIVRAALTIPMFISPIVVGIIWRMMYNPHYGLFNYFLGIRGFAPTGNEKYALFFVVLADIWQWTPFMYIIILAALQSVPPEIMEASLIDGANRRQQLFRIIMPSISYALVIAFTLRFMDATKALDIIYTLTFGGPGAATETAGFMIFRNAFNDIRIGTATAYSWMFTVMIGIFITFFMGWFNRRFEIV